ncbi:hypothetical protein [Beijerinckia sp. L45]|uniref:hypothetical protein n=1 Tax=Beijerinckia sp. L45 TaxID=1641855 RepID=UPI001AEF222B|nr:hypothetical protein [Beijerinckia sp. L45]
MRIDIVAVVGAVTRRRRHIRGRLCRPLLFAAAEQRFEKAALSWRLLKRRTLLATAAIGIEPCDQVAAIAAAARRLELAEVGLHLRDPRIQPAALWRLRAAEKEKLLAVTAELMGIGRGAGEFRALLARGTCRPIVATAAGRDLLLQPVAIDGLRVRRHGVDRRKKQRERDAGRAFKPRKTSDGGEKAHSILSAAGDLACAIRKASNQPPPAIWRTRLSVGE